MDLRWLIFYLVSVGCVSAAENCSYKALNEYLGLDNSDVLMTSLRPVHNWTTPTTVLMNLLVTSITEVDEKAQSISTQITIIIGWFSEFTRWNPNDFCGINMSSIKKEMVWIPDINIIESIKTEFATIENQHVKLFNAGIILTSNTFALTSACKMDLHQFPFDAQSCTITLQSPIHTSNELLIYPFSDSSFLTLSSKKAFQTQGEWELLTINISKGQADTIGYIQDQLIYTITIRRRPLLYVIIFLMPVFYFLVLDVASFFIDTSGSDKLSFKVTLLLSISVMLLILNDTLPSTADKIPLIGVYCSGIFCLIGISILETIIVNYLMAKGSESRSAVENTDAATGCDDGVRDLQSPPDSVIDQNEMQRSFSWTRVARITDVTFLVLYIITIIVFLSVLGKLWVVESY